MYLLHIVEVCPKHFIFIGKKYFFTDERFETSNKESVHKVHWKGRTKSSFIFKLKAQHKSATWLLCANILYFYVALFWGGLVTVFNPGYTRCGTRYSRTDQVKYFKYYFPQTLLGPFLNNLPHISLKTHFLISQPFQTDEKMQNKIKQSISLV